MKRRITCRTAVWTIVAILWVAAGAQAQVPLADSPETMAAGADSSPAAGNPAPAPSGVHTGWGWNFMVGYDLLDSGLAIGSNNGTCTLCLGRDLVSGWHFAGTRMFTENFGVTIDYSGHNSHGCYSCESVGQPDIDQDDQFFLGGITLVKPMGEHFRIFGEAFGGATLSGARNLGPGHLPLPHSAIGHHFGPSLALGGGAEYMITRRWGIRILQIDYIWSDFNMSTSFVPQPQGQWGSVNDVRMSAGIIMHLGGPN